MARCAPPEEPDPPIHTGANLRSEEQQWAKLADLARTAERFWG